MCVLTEFTLPLIQVNVKWHFNISYSGDTSVKNKHGVHTDGGQKFLVKNEAGITQVFNLDLHFSYNVQVL